MKAYIEMGIIDNIVKNLLNVYDLNTICKKTGIPLLRAKHMKIDIKFLKDKTIRYLSLPVMDLQLLWQANDLFWLDTYKEIMQSIAEQTECKYDKYSIQEFRESYSLLGITRYLNESMSTLNVWIKGVKFIATDTKVKYFPPGITADGIRTSLWDTENSYCIDWPVSKCDEMDYAKDFIVRTINDLENKYLGTFGETLEVKQHKTQDEAKDAEHWQFLLELFAEF